MQFFAYVQPLYKYMDLNVHICEKCNNRFRNNKMENSLKKRRIENMYFYYLERKVKYIFYYVK